jgi:hypothetical protein
VSIFTVTILSVNANQPLVFVKSELCRVLFTATCLKNFVPFNIKELNSTELRTGSTIHNNFTHNSIFRYLNVTPIAIIAISRVLCSSTVTHDHVHSIEMISFGIALLKAYDVILKGELLSLREEKIFWLVDIRYQVT